MIERAINIDYAGFVKRRSIPAVYVVDGALRILFSRSDPLERRSECRTDGHSLPPVVEGAVRVLNTMRSSMTPPPDTLATAPNSSLLVRVIWLAGTEEAMAVLVERLRIRDHVREVRARYALTARECEVLRLIVGGATNAEIGLRLQIAESTAIFHVKSLLTKTQARNRTELVSKVVN